jgi:hypothetical protein
LFKALAWDHQWEAKLINAVLIKKDDGQPGHNPDDYFLSAVAASVSCVRVTTLEGVFNSIAPSILRAITMGRTGLR